MRGDYEIEQANKKYKWKVIKKVIKNLASDALKRVFYDTAESEKFCQNKYLWRCFASQQDILGALEERGGGNYTKFIIIIFI